MKVAFLSQHFDSVSPPDQNSIGIWTYEVARRLGGADETSVLIRRADRGPTRSEFAGFHLERISCASARLWGQRAGGLWSRLAPRAAPLFAQRFYALDYLVQACRRLRQLAPDVIHVQNFPHHVPAIRRAVPDAAIILHMHCDWLVQLDLQAMAQCISAADMVVGCSRHVVDAARTRFDGIATPFEVLPNGAPVERLSHFRAEPRAGLVLYIGRITPEKGIHTLLEAWPAVVATFPNAHLKIIGGVGVTPREMIVDLSDDPDVRDLQRFYVAAANGGGDYGVQLRAMLPATLADTVTFLGPQPYAQILEHCATAAVLANPSLSESFGMSLVEAMATGVPVVATRVGGMTEILEATEGGWLVGKNDRRGLADAICAALADPDAARAIGRRAAPRVAELYNWDRIAAMTRELHLRALKARARHVA